MAGEHDQYVHLLRQRLTSTGLNTKDRYTARLSYATLQALLAADGQYASGVVDGLLCTVQAGTMNVQVGGGLALLYDASFGMPDSKHRWIEVQHDAPITVTLDAGDASPRWDVIEIVPFQSDGPAEIIDFYDPSLGVAVPLAAAPVKNCTPTVTARKGTPSASPDLPAGAAGRIPLAYIYVPAGAVALGVTDIAYVRPIRRPRPMETTPGTIDYIQHHLVRGGGVEVAAAGLTATLANDFFGFFSRSSAPFYAPKGMNLVLSVNNYDGGGLPGTSRVVYCYACPWPFPAGDDVSLSPREFNLRNSARWTTNYHANQRNFFYIWSSVAPVTGNKGTPNSAGNASINHPNLGAISIAYDSMVYIGSAYFDQALLQLVTQRCYGAKVGASRKTGADFEPDLPIAAPTLYAVNASIVGDPSMALPAHVRRVRIVTRFDMGVNTWIYAQFTDQFQTVGGAKPVFIYDKLLDVNALESESGCEFWAHLDDSQRVTVLLADASLVGGCVLYVYEYEDPILLAR